MSIPSHTLEQLNSQANLVEIIGKHTKLKKAGREYKGCCPFHGEKTPSFYVNPQKNVYNCFGCGVGGNAFTFLQEFENRTFMEAALELSRQTGIDIPKDDNENVRYSRKRSSASGGTHTDTQSSNPSTSMFGVPTSNTADNLKQKPASQDAKSSDNHTHEQDNFNSSNDYINHNRLNDSSPNDNRLNDISPNDANSPDYQNISNHINADYSTPPALPEHLTNYPNAAMQEPDIPGFNDNSDHYDFYAAPPPPDEFYHNEFNPNDASHPNNPPEDDTEGNLYDLLNNICQFYQHSLTQYPNALSYFKQRGLTDETIDTFSLGYAPLGWQHLEHAFPQDIEGLKILGLIRTSESGHDYDLLRDRVIFPIKDSRGRVIGFAGRALDNEVKPKYINSSESPVFHKQNVLYGYYESRQHRANDWLVVEGYMDVIALYQAGIYGAVASMGTAINETQIARLLQYNPTLTLSFDGDSAGQKAAWRTLETSLPILEDGKSLRFLTLPNGHDPDTFIEENGAEAMRRQIEQAVPLSQYVFAYLSDRHDLGLPEGKAKLMSQVRSLTSQLPKGSSFRYILNSDIYQRLSGRRNQKTAAHDALLDFDSDITISVQLELCLLFDPHLLSDDPIQSIWSRSGVATMPLPKGVSAAKSNSSNGNNVQLPHLPSWESFEDNRLVELVETITRLLPAIPKDINLSAHFILANLNNSRRQQLANRWHGFYQNLTERGIIDVSDLVDDLLVKLLEQALTRQIKKYKGIKIPAHISKQRTLLMKWYKEYQNGNHAQDMKAEKQKIDIELPKVP